MPHPRVSSRIAQILDEQLTAAHLPDTDLGHSPCQVANDTALRVGYLANNPPLSR